MALHPTGVRTFPILGGLTLDDVRTIAHETSGMPGDTSVRVHVAMGFGRNGAEVRTVILVPPPNPTDG